MLALLLGLAHAIDARVCIEAHTSYTDLNPASDYFTSNIDRRLRGITVDVKEEFGAGNVVFSGRTDVTGADVGCVTVPVSVTTGETYKVRIWAEQAVAGALVTVHDSANGMVTSEVIETNHQFFFLGGLDTTLTADPRDDWHILAVTGFALNRATGGLFGAIDTEFFIPDANGTLHPSVSCSGECIDGNAVYISSARASKAHAVAYALGFTFFEAMGGVDIDDSLDDIDYNGGGAPLHIASPEHMSAALASGYAHLYSGIVFNLTSQSDCAITNWQPTDWDLMGAPCFQRIDTPVGTFMSCAVGRSPLAPAWGQRAYYEAMGYTPPAALDVPAVPIDVVRFWWQAMQDHGLSFTDITDVYVDTSPWNWDTKTDTDIETDLEDALTSPGRLTTTQFEALRNRHL